MTSLFPETGLSSAQRSVNPFLAGVRLNYFGNSHANALQAPGFTSGPSSPVGIYINQAAAITHMQPMIRADGGAVAHEILANMIGGGSQQWGPWTHARDRGYVVIDAMRNNIHYYGDPGGASDPSSYAWSAYGECIKSMCRWLRAAPVDVVAANTGIHDVTAGTFGTWAESFGYVAARSFHRGRSLYTTQNGAYVDITFTGPEITLWTIRFRSGYSQVGGEFNVLYNDFNPLSPGTGTIQWIIPCHAGTTSTETSRGFPSNPSASPYDWYTHSTRVEVGGPSDQVNTIRVAKNATNGAERVYLDAWATPNNYLSFWPPKALLMQDGIESQASSGISAERLEDAYVAYRAMHSVIAADAEFSPFVSTVDLPGWDADQMVVSTSPYVHDNDRGAQYKAERLVATMNLGLNTWNRGVHVV